MYRHPYHKKFIPPGGRASSKEFPDIALINRLKERVGLVKGDYTFNETCHPNFNKTNSHIGQVERMPVPFVIQKEIRRQRLFKKFHYDFIYVIDLLNKNVVFPDNKYHPFRFVNFEILHEMVRSNETFPDVADTYERILLNIKK